ncbi:MAG: histone deacetylase, partial [Nitrospinota bacterium]|nr:histone deacetylase [Nitrospinota bacterium]
HHAEAQRAMGFCLFNNVAIAARHATRKSGAQRVAIIDFDVHHGNGTQSAFYEDPSVYFVSFHQAAIYPGTGWTEETGANQGAHTTLNFPMGPLCGDEIYLESLRNVVFPKLSEFRPELILLSAGFDAHQSDPIGGMAITTEGFYRITSAIKSFADQTCGGKVVSLLEGGYDIKTLGDAVTAHVKALLDL